MLAYYYENVVLKIRMDKRQQRNRCIAHLEVTGCSLIIDMVGVVVLKDDVVDQPVNLRCRLSLGITRHVTRAAGPRMCHATVVALKSWRNCNHTH